MAPTDVLIVGGGFTGLATAAALADGRRKILVLEARAGRDPRFRGELIHPPGVRELERLGFTPPMRASAGTDVNGFAVIADLERPVVQLPYELPPSGEGQGYAMEHHRLVDVMREVVGARAGVEIRTGERAADVLRDNGRVVGVRTAAGTEHRAALTLVAEGRLSKLRSHLGLDGEMKLLSYSAALLAEGAELPRPGYGHVVFGAPGPMLAYPIGGGVRFCIDVPLDTARGRDAIALRLRNEYARHLPPLLRDALHLALDRDTLEICATQQLHTYRCQVPGAALVGDAGGCSHPITATGMTTSLRDVRTLATALDEAASRNGNTDAALQTYERRRYRYVRMQEILTERLYEVFVGRDAGLLALRDGMLNYWEGTARARVASMKLLSGETTAISSFAREFVTVFGYAASAAVRTSPGTQSRAIRERCQVVGEMTGVTLRMLRRATSTALHTATLS